MYMSLCENKACDNANAYTRVHVHIACIAIHALRTCTHADTCSLCTCIHKARYIKRIWVERHMYMHIRAPIYCPSHNNSRRPGASGRLTRASTDHVIGEHGF